MIPKAQSLLLTDLIAIGYDDRFLVAPEAVAKVRLAALGFSLVSVVWGVDFKGLFGQERVPYGLIATDPQGQPYCAIRGTDDAKEWLEDAWAFPEPWPFAEAGVHTHKGFTDVYQTLCDDTGTPLLAVLAPMEVIVTGHSLGGALAYLIGAALGQSCSLLQTFEAPRAGDKAFCNWMDGRVKAHFRTVIVGDLVPHAPPELLGYSHAGIEIDMDPAGLAIPADTLPLDRARFLHVLPSVQRLIASMP